MRIIGLNIVRFIFLIALQLLVVNQIGLGFLSSYISITVYMSFLFTFPVKISKYLLLVVSLLLGLTIDMFQNTDGIHASACLFMAYVRPFILNRIQSESPMEEIHELTIYREDAQKYILYCLLMSLSFFFWLFLLEEFSISKLPLVLVKTLLSGVFSALFIVIGQFLLFKKPKNH